MPEDGDIDEGLLNASPHAPDASANASELPLGRAALELQASANASATAASIAHVEPPSSRAWCLAAAVSTGFALLFLAYEVGECTARSAAAYRPGDDAEAAPPAEPAPAHDKWLLFTIMLCVVLGSDLYTTCAACTRAPERNGRALPPRAVHRHTCRRAMRTRPRGACVGRRARAG